MVARDSDSARGSSSSYSSGESYTTSVPDNGEQRPTVSRHGMGGMAGGRSGSSTCCTNHVACYHGEYYTHLHSEKLNVLKLMNSVHAFLMRRQNASALGSVTSAHIALK
jgi:hypothetical protein